MTDDTCTFSYIAKGGYEPRTATGVERTWLDLKLEFGRRGEGIPGAKYYKTISEKGPQLFAVKPDQSVWYHDEGKWHRYQTATDVKFGKLNSPLLDPTRKFFTSTSNDQADDDESNFGTQDEAE
jgi:hypothetical protein